jgi:hypothetical protein
MAAGARGLPDRDFRRALDVGRDELPYKGGAQDFSGDTYGCGQKSAWRSAKLEPRKPWRGRDMTEQAKAVVDGFERLTPDEQTQVYLAIEQIWKGQQDDGEASDAPTHELKE